MMYSIVAGEEGRFFFLFFFLFFFGVFPIVHIDRRRRRLVGSLFSSLEKVVVGVAWRGTSCRTGSSDRSWV